MGNTLSNYYSWDDYIRILKPIFGNRKNYHRYLETVLDICIEIRCRLMENGCF